MSALTIQLPSRLKSKLAATAKRPGKSPQQLAQEAFEASLETTTAPTSTLFDLSRDLCGTVNGGPSELARNKKHLKAYGSWKR
jgi:hypothetical protein